MFRAVVDQGIPVDIIWLKGPEFIAVKKGVSCVWVTQGKTEKSGDLSFNTHELCVNDVNSHVSRLCETLYNRGYRT